MPVPVSRHGKPSRARPRGRVTFFATKARAEIRSRAPVGRQLVGKYAACTGRCVLRGGARQGFDESVMRDGIRIDDDDYVRRCGGDRIQGVAGARTPSRRRSASVRSRTVAPCARARAAVSSTQLSATTITRSSRPLAAQRVEAGADAARLVVRRNDDDDARSHTVRRRRGASREQARRAFEQEHRRRNEEPQRDDDQRDFEQHHHAGAPTAASRGHAARPPSAPPRRPAASSARPRARRDTARCGARRADSRRTPRGSP